MTTEANMDKLGKDLNELSGDAKGMMQDTAGETSERMNELRNRLTSALDAAKITYQKLQEKRQWGHLNSIQNFPRESLLACP